MVTFGEYNLLGLLASGGMSDVFLAEECLAELQFCRPVALKLMHANSTPAGWKLIRDEAVSLARINHPNVVRLYRIDRRREHFFMVMELLEGVTIKHIFAQSATRSLGLPPGLIAALGKQICDGLHAAHEATDARGHPLGLVHRDVKPANLMLTRDGVVKLIDFGIALSNLRLRQTRPGLVVGTPAYMSPEQTAVIPTDRASEDPAVTGRPAVELDRRTDLWALGVILHELCTGRRLFSSSDIRVIISRVNFAPIPALADCRPDLPPRLANLIHHLLARDPTARPATANEVAAELRGIVRDEGNHFGDAEALVEYLRNSGYDLTPRRPGPIPPERLRWLETNRPRPAPPPKRSVLPQAPTGRRANLPADGQTSTLEHGALTLTLTTLELDPRGRIARPLPFPLIPGLAPLPLTARARTGIPIIEIEEDPLDPTDPRRAPSLYQLAHQPSTRLARFHLSTPEGHFEYGHRDHGVIAVHTAAHPPMQAPATPTPPLPLTLTALALDLALPRQAAAAAALWVQSDANCVHIVCLIIPS